MDYPEVPGELRLVCRDVLNADDAYFAVELDDAVDEQKGYRCGRISMICCVSMMTLTGDVSPAAACWAPFAVSLIATLSINAGIALASISSRCSLVAVPGRTDPRADLCCKSPSSGNAATPCRRSSGAWWSVAS